MRMIRKYSEEGMRVIRPASTRVRPLVLTRSEIELLLRAALSVAARVDVSCGERNTALYLADRCQSQLERVRYRVKRRGLGDPKYKYYNGCGVVNIYPLTGRIIIGWNVSPRITGKAKRAMNLLVSDAERRLQCQDLRSTIRAICLKYGTLCVEAILREYKENTINN